MVNIAIGVWLVLCGAALVVGWYPLVKSHRDAARAAKASGSPKARWFPYGRQQRTYVLVGSSFVLYALGFGLRAINIVAEATDLLHLLGSMVLIVASVCLLVGGGLLIFSQQSKLLDRSQQQPPPAA